jgi:hypothetical protein
LVPLEKIIICDQVEWILAMGAGDALGVITQNTQSFLILLRKMVALTVFAVVVVTLPEQDHGCAAVRAVHRLIFLSLGTSITYHNCVESIAERSRNIYSPQ